MKLTDNNDNYNRYDRQIMLPEVGREGQNKLQEADVLIAGTGGLGSISAYYLVAAGIGSITIIDSDDVELTNLNRQILHRTDDVGRPKVISASEKLVKLNPHCRINPVKIRIDENNIGNLAEKKSLIVDATDNFETRRILNRVSIDKGIPFIYGGVEGFHGMVSTFVPGETPCFECIFPGKSKGTDRFGIMGPVPGLIASIQALEAIKLIIGIGQTLKGRLLYYSGLDMTFRQFDLQTNPECKTCKNS